jgi:hypothetical protein
MEVYTKEAPFAKGLGEFDEAKKVVMGLVGEYEAASKVTILILTQAKGEVKGMNNDAGKSFWANHGVGNLARRVYRDIQLLCTPD